MANVLEFQQISRHYMSHDQRLVVLDQASFSVKKGEMVALVAPSGAGKSTLLHIAGLLEKPDSGNLLIKGRSCATLSDHEKTLMRCSSIGFVYQFHHLLPEFTALENVMLPQMIAGIKKEHALYRARKILSYLRVDHRADNRPSEMSGGEQQRVAIGRAVANMPALLLADEPTGNLDPDTAYYVFEALLHLVHSFQLSALIATHNHDLAKKMDRAITIKNGKICKIF